MHPYHKNNDFPALDERFRQAAQNYRVPADPQLWKRIQQGIQEQVLVSPTIQKEYEKDNKKAFYLPKWSIWSAGISIAASIALWGVFLMNTSDQHMLPNQVATQTTINPIPTHLETSEKVVAETTAITESSSENINANQHAVQRDEKIPLKMANRATYASATTSTKKYPIKPKKATQQVAQQQLVADNSTSKTAKLDTKIADGVWTSDFVVKSDTKHHTPQYEKQTVAITIKVGNSTSYETSYQANAANSTNEASVFADPNSQFGKAKNVLKEVWNLKTGKKVNLQNILPNNETHQNQTQPTNYAEEDAE